MTYVFYWHPKPHYVNEYDAVFHNEKSHSHEGRVMSGWIRTERTALDAECALVRASPRPGETVLNAVEQ